MNQLLGTDIKIGIHGYLSTFIHPRLVHALKIVVILIVSASNAERGDWLYSELNTYAWMAYVDNVLTFPILILIIIDSVLIGNIGYVRILEDSVVIARDGRPEQALSFKDIEHVKLRKDYGKLYDLQLNDSKMQVVLKGTQKDDLLQLMEGNGVEVTKLNAVQKFTDIFK